MSQQQSSLAWEESVDEEQNRAISVSEPALTLLVQKEKKSRHASKSESVKTVRATGSITVSF